MLKKLEKLVIKKNRKLKDAIQFNKNDQVNQIVYQSFHSTKNNKRILEKGECCCLLTLFGLPLNVDGHGPCQFWVSIRIIILLVLFDYYL